MSTSKILKQANKASVKEIAEAAQLNTGSMTLRDTEFTTRVAKSYSLNAGIRADIWSIMESNMRSLLEPSSLGWDAKAKKKETFHSDSRFILVYHQKSEDEPKILVAFTIFRFELGYMDEASVYCYELQVLDGFRGLGLGRFLVEKLMTIGEHWQMEKILLTVLRSNTSARKVYDKLGFQLDPSSPEYPESGADEEDGKEETEEADYEILSMEL